MSKEGDRAHAARLWRNAFIGLLLVAPAVVLGTVNGNYLKDQNGGRNQPIDISSAAFISAGLVLPSLVVGGAYGAFAARSAVGRALAGSLLTFVGGALFVFTVIMVSTKRDQWGTTVLPMSEVAAVGMAAASVAACSALAAILATGLGLVVDRARGPPEIAQVGATAKPQPLVDVAPPPAPPVRVEVKAGPMPDPRAETRAHAEEALGLVKKRMALGEITKEDYDQIVKRIRE